MEITVHIDLNQWLKHTLWVLVPLIAVGFVFLGEDCWLAAIPMLAVGFAVLGTNVWILATLKG